MRSIFVNIFLEFCRIFHLKHFYGIIDNTIKMTDDSGDDEELFCIEDEVGEEDENENVGGLQPANDEKVRPDDENETLHRTNSAKSEKAPIVEEKAAPPLLKAAPNRDAPLLDTAPNNDAPLLGAAPNNRVVENNRETMMNEDEEEESFCVEDEVTGDDDDDDEIAVSAPPPKCEDGERPTSAPHTDVPVSLLPPTDKFLSSPNSVVVAAAGEQQQQKIGELRKTANSVSVETAPNVKKDETTDKVIVRPNAEKRPNAKNDDRLSETASNPKQQKLSLPRVQSKSLTDDNNKTSDHVTPTAIDQKEKTEPNQILNAEKRKRSKTIRRQCILCRKKGHVADHCPLKADEKTKLQENLRQRKQAEIRADFDATDDPPVKDEPAEVEEAEEFTKIIELVEISDEEAKAEESVRAKKSANAEESIKTEKESAKSKESVDTKKSAKMEKSAKTEESAIAKKPPAASVTKPADRSEESLASAYKQQQPEDNDAKMDADGHSTIEGNDNTGCNEEMTNQRTEPLPEVALFVDSLTQVSFDWKKYTCFYCNPCQIYMTNTALWEEHMSHSSHKKNIVRWKACNALQKEIKRDSKPAKHQKDVNASKDLMAGVEFITEVSTSSSDALHWVCRLCNSVCSSVEFLLSHLSGFSHVDNFMEHVAAYLYNPPTLNSLKSSDGTARHVSSDVEKHVVEECRRFIARYGKGKMTSYCGDTARDFMDVDEDQEEMEETLLAAQVNEFLSEEQTYNVTCDVRTAPYSVANKEYDKLSSTAKEQYIGLQYLLELWAPSRRVIAVWYCMLCDSLVIDWTKHCEVVQHIAAYLKKDYKKYVFDCAVLEASNEEELRNNFIIAKNKVLQLEGCSARVKHVIHIKKLQEFDSFVAINAKIAKQLVKQYKIEVGSPPRKPISKPLPPRPTPIVTSSSSDPKKKDASKTEKSPQQKTSTATTTSSSADKRSESTKRPSDSQQKQQQQSSRTTNRNSPIRKAESKSTNQNRPAEKKGAELPPPPPRSTCERNDKTSAAYSSSSSNQKRKLDEKSSSASTPAQQNVKKQAVSGNSQQEQYPLPKDKEPAISKKDSTAGQRERSTASSKEPPKTSSHANSQVRSSGKDDRGSGKDSRNTGKDSSSGGKDPRGGDGKEISVTVTTTNQKSDTTTTRRIEYKPRERESEKRPTASSAGTSKMYEAVRTVPPPVRTVPPRPQPLFPVKERPAPVRVYHPSSDRSRRESSYGRSSRERQEYRREREHGRDEYRDRRREHERALSREHYNRSRTRSRSRGHGHGRGSSRPVNNNRPPYRENKKALLSAEPPSYRDCGDSYPPPPPLEPAPRPTLFDVAAAQAALPLCELIPSQSQQQKSATAGPFVFLTNEHLSKFTEVMRAVGVDLGRQLVMEDLQMLRNRFPDPEVFDSLLGSLLNQPLIVPPTNDGGSGMIESDFPPPQSRSGGSTNDPHSEQQQRYGYNNEPQDYRGGGSGSGKNNSENRGKLGYYRKDEDRGGGYGSGKASQNSGGSRYGGGRSTSHTAGKPQPSNANSSSPYSNRQGNTAGRGGRDHGGEQRSWDYGDSRGNDSMKPSGLQMTDPQMDNSGRFPADSGMGGLTANYPPPGGILPIPMVQNLPLPPPSMLGMLGGPALNIPPPALTPAYLNALNSMGPFPVNFSANSSAGPYEPDINRYNNRNR